MTNPNSHSSPADPTAQIRFPGIAVFLFIIAPFFLIFGFLIFMGASTRDFFSGAPFQSSLGLVVFMTGVLSLLSAVVLAGVDGIARRHTKALLAAGRAVADE